MSRRWLMLAAAGLVLLGLPYLACSSREGSGDPSKSEADLKAAVLGTWQGTAEIDGETVPFSLTLQPVAARAATARSLFLTGSLTSENPDVNGALDGAASAEVDGDALEVRFRLDDGKIFSGRVESGAITDGRINDKAPVGSFSMSRQ